MHMPSPEPKQSLSLKTLNHKPTALLAFLSVAFRSNACVDIRKCRYHDRELQSLSVSPRANGRDARLELSVVARLVARLLGTGGVLA